MTYTGELIGMPISVTHSKISGTIIDETEYTITIKTTQGERLIQKKGHIFNLKTPNGDITIQGKNLAHKPHERIKGNKE
ncbi:MAG: ribonuclease P protein subunit [Nanoarchaeota archaeon]